MAALDNNAINGYSSSGTDWKAKYMEVADMLAETRAELDDFHQSSKELEEELERELERTEKSQQELKIKVARAEQERDDWKAKFMHLQTTHNTTTTSLQRELDTLRQEHQKTKIQLRELEMGNDDLERNERAISSSLADVEQKYAKALEEKILLEHELLDKANVEEQCQRMKDELRDANEEISILKDQLNAAQQRALNVSAPSGDSSVPSLSLPHATPSLSDEDLLSVPTPPDLCLDDLTPPPETPAKDFPPTPLARRSKGVVPITPPTVLQRAGFTHRNGISTPLGGVASLARSSTHPGLVSSPSRLHAPLPVPRTPVSVSRPLLARSTTLANSTASTTAGIPSTASKSKGVQMVSEMRARVKLLEQKIHTRVPRLRMGSVSRSPAVQIPVPLPPIPTKAAASPVPSTASSSRSTTNDDRSATIHKSPSKSRRPSVDVAAENRRTVGGADTSGWVLIMEDSPSPSKDKDKERRRVSGTSTGVPSAFRTSLESPSSIRSSRAGSALSQSAVRRPQSRLSVSTEGRSSVSTTATTSTASSIPTPSSRPSTPTFLPLPSASMYGGGNTGLKRSTGPGSGAYSQSGHLHKRSSLGASIHASPTLESPTYSSHSNITIRPTKMTAIPAPGLSQSRIGKPVAGRRSGGGSDPEPFFFGLRSGAARKHDSAQ
ncbi:hypothetical protein OH76DRAFT_1401018 [Lentinus brumalis]|uniref:NUDE domain-containing protein n=1 Tax=Lentinus brumalis TaxID=2498619 RepID=A0A371DHX6_9APHY|nr:hypothetical protein OH76DRAFT_1401018 [Polyporus brumalis]